jgi:hypothetical protein
MFTTLLALSTLIPALGGSSPSRVSRSAWFDLGHRVVAQIAEGRLTPHTAAAVRDILGGQDISDASLWADQIRGQRRSTGPLHYVNIPLDAAAYDSAAQCPGGQCIIAAIESDRRVLADPASSSIERAEALKFLIHFMGDLHQPLHVSNNNDRGGNQAQVQFFGAGTNLHKVWDGLLIERADVTDADQYLARLTLQMALMELGAFERGTVVDWAMEGHQIAVENAYRIPRNRQLAEPYEAANIPLVDLAIIKAGVRLAMVLNEALANYQPAQPAASLGPGVYTDQQKASLGPGVYTDQQAAAHVGETAMVVGTVATVHRTRSGSIYLNFGADYPHQTFSGAVLDPRDAALRNLDGLVGKRVGIRGLIKLYKGQAEIVITSMEQIVVEP